MGWFAGPITTKPTPGYMLTYMFVNLFHIDCLVAQWIKRWTLNHKTFASGNALLEVVSIGGSVPQEKALFCIQYNSLHQTLPSTVKDATPYDLIDFSNIEGCNASEYRGHQIFSSRPIVAVARGGCTFTDKAAVAESQMAAAVLVVDDKDSTSTPLPGGNKTEFNAFNISLAVIAWQDYRSLLDFQQKIRVSLYSPPPLLWDGNMVFIVFASTILVMAGGAWAAYSEEHALRQHKSNASKSRDSTDGSNDEEEGNPFTVTGVLIWFFFICATILLLYFFYNYMVYVFIALFCIVGAHSLYRCLLPLWTYIMPINYDIPLNRLPCFKSKAKLGSLILLMPCVTIAIFWAVERHSAYAWILQDILGASFCIFLIQSLRLPSLKIIGILLVLLLVYDVFFVFITPLFTSDGESVMVSVATGGKGGSKESLPMVFLIPLFGSSPQYKCRERAYSLLGFGDVIIPGLLVAYNAVCDVRLKGNRCTLCMPYYLTAVTGYMFGMAVCMVSLILMESGQPALLYLVPCTLIPTVTMAACRKQFVLLFRGHATIYVFSLDDVEAQVGAASDSERHVQVDNVGEEEEEEEEEVSALVRNDRDQEHINLIH
ncbi:signal peptide peptidase-like 2b [Plakobranchus ocellatus]|uniref:Signal peptide peptidase-like 2b n=1 Tax=Plakobranchus ocellatus TaxID=259542 RepID=A0AAV4AWB8_9GAST|nr:signal peptide peptidase-like 2b [Plakobranchus ocellatus]